VFHVGEKNITWSKGGEKHITEEPGVRIVHQGQNVEIRTGSVYTKSDNGTRRKKATGNGPGPEGGGAEKQKGMHKRRCNGPKKKTVRIVRRERNKGPYRDRTVRVEDKRDQKGKEEPGRERHQLSESKGRTRPEEPGEGVKKRFQEIAEGKAEGGGASRKRRIKTWRGGWEMRRKRPRIQAQTAGCGEEPKPRRGVRLATGPGPDAQTQKWESGRIVLNPVQKSMG